MPDIIFTDFECHGFWEIPKHCSRMCSIVPILDPAFLPRTRSSFFVVMGCAVWDSTWIPVLKDGNDMKSPGFGPLRCHFQCSKQAFLLVPRFSKKGLHRDFADVVYFVFPGEHGYAMVCRLSIRYQAIAGIWSSCPNPKAPEKPWTFCGCADPGI